MKEIETIIAEYEQLKAAGTHCILATVVHVAGSSYRRAGARMLVDEFGNITGAISGGCLEGDALRKALLAMERQENKLVTYDTSDEDDAVIGAQLGCNGIIQVVFEPLDFQDKYNACETLKVVITQDRPLAIVVGFNLDKSKSQLGTFLLVNEEGNVTGKPIHESVSQWILEKSKEVTALKQSYFGEVYDGEEKSHVFIQAYQPPVKLVLVGAGNDAQILANQAELLGWKVIVTDGRPTHANAQRFAPSCQIIVSKPEQTLQNIKIDERTCFVLISHNYNYDLAVLKLLLHEAQIPYIGILGPLKKWQRMQEDLQQEGIEVSDENLKKIHAPVGLEIGAETPAEIGLSILAEIQKVLTKNSGNSLKEKETPIHEHKQSKFQKVSV